MQESSVPDYSESIRTSLALLRARWLLVAHVVWITITLLGVTLYVMAIPVAVAHFRAVCPTVECNDGRLSANQFDPLSV
jgi:hypothetical protein